MHTFVFTCHHAWMCGHVYLLFFMHGFVNGCVDVRVNEWKEVRVSRRLCGFASVRVCVFLCQCLCCLCCTPVCVIVLSSLRVLSKLLASLVGSSDLCWKCLCHSCSRSTAGGIIVCQRHEASQHYWILAERFERCQSLPPLSPLWNWTWQENEKVSLHRFRWKCCQFWVWCVG